MNTVGDLKTRTLLLLGDSVVSAAGQEISGATYTPDILVAGIHASLDAILPWVWKKQVYALNTSPDGYVFDLPTDLFRIEGVTPSTTIQTTNRITYATFSPVRTFVAKHQLETEYEYWLPFPQGKITFSKIIDLNAGAKLFYAGTWTKPTLDATVLETPEYALAALSFYAASHCVLGKATATANIRQYGTRVDSGTPTDNPLLEISTYFLRMFDVAVQRLPQLTHGVIE